MKVAIVLKNADFTEGRGPMFIDRVFSSVEKAEGYIMGQGGIFGSPQYKEPASYSDTGYLYNGYDIKLMEIE